MPKLSLVPLLLCFKRNLLANPLKNTFKYTSLLYDIHKNKLWSGVQPDILFGTMYGIQRVTC